MRGRIGSTIKTSFSAEVSNGHRYEIARGTSTIDGCRQGNLETVMTAVKEHARKVIFVVRIKIRIPN